MNKLLYLRNSLKLTYVCYSLIILLTGIILVFLIPPFQSPDEQTHLYRAYQLSEGHVTTKHLSYGAGDLLPKSLSDSFENYRYIIFKPDEKVSRGLIKSSLSANLNKSNVVETRFENTATYPPLSYLPQIIGICLGKILSASPVLLLYLARIFNLAAWVTILFLCMKRNKRVTLPILAFALLPVVACQASSASADVMTSGVAIFYTLEILRLIYTRSIITKSDKLFIIIPGIILALCKPPYVILTLLSVMLSHKKFESKKASYKFKLLACVLPVIITAIWIIVAYKGFVNLKDGVNSIVQLKFILSKPFEYIAVIFNTYVSNASDGLYIQMIGQLGWLDTKLLFWNILFGFLAVILSVFAIPLKTSDNPMPKYIKLWTIAVTTFLIIAITSLLYLTWNTPRAAIIDGLQGRYFIPLIGVIIIIFGGFLSLSTKQSNKVKYLVYFLSGSTIISALIIILFRYYRL